MSRHAWAVIVAFLFAGRLVADNPVAPANSLETTLALQKAMVMARSFLRMDDPARAVEVLEQHLAKVNGHQAYLELLRDAYRALIKELCLKNQATEARRYTQRLTILDPSAANDPTLRPGESPKFVPAATRDEKPAMPLPNYAQTHGAQTPSQPTRPPQIEVTPTSAVKPTTIRGMREIPQDDPFDPSNQRVIAAQAPEVKVGELLAKAHKEFDRAQYAQARHYYEQVVQLDRSSMSQLRDRLAYCMLDTVVQKLNTDTSAPLGELRQQVRGAMSMSPQLSNTGTWLLKEIDERGRRFVAGSTPDVVPDPPLNLQHYGKNPQGWQVTETTNFRIFHNQERELIERVALIAERTRVTMARKWFGSEGVTWTPKCELVLHATASEYSRQTGVSSSSPGHSRIETDPTTYRVIGRRIDLHLDALGFLEAVLPHEATHVVLAGNFGQHQVPRWADEGVAVLTEPLEKIEQHRRNLLKNQREGLLFPVRDLMHLQNYPQPRQIGAFYAQSVILVEFLTSQRGPNAFTEFVRDGLNEGYETALRKHYGWTFQDLQTQWDREVLGEMQKLAAGR